MYIKYSVSCYKLIFVVYMYTVKHGSVRMLSYVFIAGTDIVVGIIIFTILEIRVVPHKRGSCLHLKIFEYIIHHHNTIFSYITPNSQMNV